MASRISLAEAQSLPDILSAENYRFQLGTVPGADDASSLDIKCQTVSIPGRQNQAFEVPLGGFMRSFSGLARWSSTLQVGYVEDITMNTLFTMRTWLEQIRGTQSGTAIGDIANYAINPLLTVFDQAGNIVDTINFYNLWIVELNEVQLETSQSQAIQVQVQFRYDYLVYQNIELR